MTEDHDRNGRWILRLALAAILLGLAVAWLRQDDDGPTRPDPRFDGDAGTTT